MLLGFNSTNFVVVIVGGIFFLITFSHLDFLLLEEDCLEDDDGDGFNRFYVMIIYEWLLTLVWLDSNSINLWFQYYSLFYLDNTVLFNLSTILYFSMLEHILFTLYLLPII